MSYWNDLWPGYDKPRGLPCCKTNERGYPCQCKEPAPIPEGVRKADPYVEPALEDIAKEALKSTIKEKLAARRAERIPNPEEPYADELGEAPGLYIPRSTIRRQGVSQKREALCAFEHNGGFFLANVQRPFKPLGLMIWGALSGATLEAAYIGNQFQLLVSMGKFPAAWFAQSQSFEQIFERAKEGLVPAGFGDWDTCEVGCMIRVIIESTSGERLGPQDGVQIGMWGWTITP